MMFEKGNVPVAVPVGARSNVAEVAVPERVILPAVPVAELSVVIQVVFTPSFDKTSPVVVEVVIG